MARSFSLSDQFYFGAWRSGVFGHFFRQRPATMIDECEVWWAMIEKPESQDAQFVHPLQAHGEIEKRIMRRVSPVLETMGYDLVRVKYSQGSGPARMQIMIERCDGAATTIEDCTRASRALSAVLDVEDPVSHSYGLEVSSPGVDRPLVRIDDFIRFAGFEARVETSEIFEGRRRFRGHLLGADKGIIHMKSAAEEYAIPFELISRAQLILTDELLQSFGRSPA